MSINSISKKLNMARQELLDLGLRNPLLNYRTLKARGLEIVDESPSDVYNILVADKKSMTFLEASEKKHVIGNDEKQQNAETDPEKVPNYKDLKLQTNYNDKQLQSRLLSTYTAARTYIEEQGVNILYMALGMLNWYDSDQSEDCRKAPLILIPVKLERVNARERFTITYTEDELGYNVSLITKMKNEFGLVLPSLEDEEFDIQQYFSNVSEAIASQKRWSINSDSVVIGFFSFGKFLMYWDLDVENWPEHTKPLDHPIISALLEDGFREPSSSIGEDDHLDQHYNLNDCHLIKDADSSQIMAILDANQGRNLVIQGPPGTGKSQTITNLISEAIGRGKKVLFVSEKMAALEVVKRRLDEAGLGVACLELHSHKTNKKTLLTELATTLELGKPVHSESYSVATLNDLRNRLNEYCNSVYTPIANSGVTPYQALGELVRYQVKFKDVPFTKLEVAYMNDWKAEKFFRRGNLIEELQSVIKAMGVPTEHPFWGSKKKVVMPHELDELKHDLTEAIGTSSLLKEQLIHIAEQTTSPIPQNGVEAEVIIKLCNQVNGAPDINGVMLESDKWINTKEMFDRLVKTGIRYRELHSKYNDLFIPGGWEQDMMAIRQSLVSYQDKWWRFLSSDYRKAKNMIKALFRVPNEISKDFLQIVDAIIEVQQSRKAIFESENLMKELTGSYWNGVDTNWEAVSTLVSWSYNLHKDIRSKALPFWSINFIVELVGSTDFKQLISELKSTYEQNLRNFSQIEEMLELDSPRRFENKLQLYQQEFKMLDDLLNVWLKRAPDVQQIASYNQLVEVCNEQELAPLTQLSQSWELAASMLLDCYRWNWYQVLSTKAFHDRPVLAQFEGRRHEQVIKKFRELDQELSLINRFKLAEEHWKKLPQYDAGGQLGVLRREFEKKSRHLPIRQLMQKAGNAIQVIKPVFMMGPLSIASFLPPGSLEFDLVIFDEASQVKPVDAFGAIIRGKQAVVVGDSKQMPPSNFFDSISKEDDVEEEDLVSDMESILGLFVGQNAPQRMLRWHYRSRHESLITVSNHEFYDNKLVVFPSPDAAKNDAGLIYRYLPETSYDRGRTRTNKEEAKSVATAVLEHAMDNPNLSLGVAAFSMAQMQAIMDEIEMIRRSNPSIEGFFLSHPHEPFFVKNLENVQGDERDVIFISIGYGKTVEGYLAMDFGPLNREGGERRLNVLITRARIRCEVFTNLKSDDIDLNRSKARGVKSLKTFLKYAESGNLDVPIVTGKDFDSPFEEAVYSSLVNAGYEVKAQVGSVGFFVDLAVVDPQMPGRFILGVECDGATYHSARSARDRDRLRQEVLEGLGWKIHRIWSTDWFRHPERELKRVIEAIEKAKAVGKMYIAPNKKGNIDDNEIARVNFEPIVHDNGVVKYEHADIKINLLGQEFHTLPTSIVAGWVQDVVKVESPVHVNEVIKRICDAAGLKRAGSRIQGVIEASIKLLTGTVIQKGNFLWIKNMSEPTVRDRKDLTNKKIEFVDSAEIASAISVVVKASFGLEKNNVPQAVGNLLGFSRLTDGNKNIIFSIVNDLLASKRLIIKDNQIVMG